MAKKRVLSFALVFFLILQIFTAPFAVPASAAAKNGLQTLNGKMYYYAKGKKVKNTWKNVKGQRYYFGKDGAACKGRKTIGKDRYYFDKDCRMVRDKVVTIDKNKYYFLKSGKAAQQAAQIKGKIWTLSKNGKMLKNINVYAKAGKSFDEFIKRAGKPKKSERTSNCMKPGMIGTYTYDNFTVRTYEENGVRKITQVWGL